MNNITITISAPELVEAMQALTVALQSGSVKPAQVEQVIEKLETEAEATKPSKSAKPKAQNEAKAPQKTEDADKPEPTLEDVRAVLGTLSQTGKQAEVKQLIASMGATKLTEIDKSKYAELLAKAEAL